MNHKQAAAFSLNKIKGFKQEHQDKLKKLYWWQYGKIQEEKNNVRYYEKLLKDLGPAPDNFDIALTVPDHILAKMGW